MVASQTLYSFSGKMRATPLRRKPCSAESSAVLVNMAKTACACPHLYVDFQRLSASLGKYDKCRISVIVM